MRRKPNRILWGEGLLVCPQHFQQQDLYFHASLHDRFRWHDPYGWGLTSIDIDSVALADGAFALRSVAGLSSQGDVFELGEGDAGLPAAREVGSAFEPTAAVLEVFLGIPVSVEGAENYAPLEDVGAARRYQTWARTVVDLVDGSTEVPVQFARPSIVVLFGTEDREHFDTIKIAEIRRDEHGGVALVEDFIPPTLRVGAATALERGLRDILATMIAKRRALAGVLRQVDEARIELSSRDITRAAQLAAIASHIPLMRQLSETPQARPYDAYRTLAALAGHLTTFVSDIAPEDIPTYVHDDARTTFNDLFDKIRRLLELTMTESIIEIPLEARRDGMWISMLKDPRIAECRTVVLALDAKASHEDIANRVPRLSKIASWKRIPKIVRSAIPGAPLQVARRPPPEIPVRPHETYFMIDTSHDYWAQIVREKTLSIFLPPPFGAGDAKARLFAVPNADRPTMQGRSPT